MTRRIAFITIHPAFVEAYTQFGVLAAARNGGVADFSFINLRDFAVDRHGTVDGAPYGGGDGMILRPEPLAAAVASLGPGFKVVMPSPAGALWTQETANQKAAAAENLIFICGRFGGIDQRFVDQYVHEEWSIGDVIVSGGELPALLMVDSLLRQCEGVLGNTDSSQLDSFSPSLQGGLEAPQYTRPPVFQGHVVPDVLMSGNHPKIQAWRQEQSRELTRRRRPDLLK